MASLCLKKGTSLPAPAKNSIAGGTLDEEKVDWLFGHPSGWLHSIFEVILVPVTRVILKITHPAVSSSRTAQRLRGMASPGGSLLSTDLETVVQHLRMQK